MVKGIFVALRALVQFSKETLGLVREMDSNSFIKLGDRMTGKDGEVYVVTQVVPDEDRTLLILEKQDRQHLTIGGNEFPAVPDASLPPDEVSLRKKRTVDSAPGALSLIEELCLSTLDYAAEHGL